MRGVSHVHGGASFKRGIGSQLRPTGRFSARDTKNLDRATPDKELVKAIAGGHRQAMQTLYTRHSVRVYRFVLRLTQDSTLAEDIVSDVFCGFGAKPMVSGQSRKCRRGSWRSLEIRRSPPSGAAPKRR